MKIALVEWLDATRTDETVTATMSIGVVRKTVGWILRDDTTGVVIAMTQDETDFERGFTIPRAYVRSCRPLRAAPRAGS